MFKKELIFLSPEIYLICATIYYWILTSNLFNPFAIGLLTILLFQIIYKKENIGLLIASIFILLNLYLVLAWISELFEFSEPNADSKKLLIFGALFLGLNLLAGSFMFWKYLKRKLSDS